MQTEIEAPSAVDDDRHDPPPAQPGAERSGSRTRRRAVAVLVLAALGAMLGLAISRSLPRPDPPPVPLVPGSGIWMPQAELAALPTSGDAWQRLRIQAETGAGEPVDVSCQDSKHAAATSAVALVAARLDDASLRRRARDAISAVVGTEGGSSCGHGDRNRVLGVARNLAAYVIAADLIDLRTLDPGLDSTFRSWIATLRSEPPSPGHPDLTLARLDATDPGNWAGYAGASRVAISQYLGDTADVMVSAEAFRHFVSDGTGFEYREAWDMSWACDPARPTPINPPCRRDGHELGGIVTADMRRGDGYRWPPAYTQYPRETIVGRAIQAELLARAGFPSFEWGDRALLRAAERLAALDDLDDDWFEPEINAYWLIRHRLGGLHVAEPASGRGVAGVDWTHR